MDRDTSCYLQRLAPSISQIKATSIYQATIRYYCNSGFQECPICRTHGANCRMPCGHDICLECRSNMGGEVISCAFCRRSVVQFKTSQYITDRRDGYLLEHRDGENTIISVLGGEPLSDFQLANMLPVLPEPTSAVDACAKELNAILLGPPRPAGYIIAEGRTFEASMRVGCNVDSGSDFIDLTIRWKVSLTDETNLIVPKKFFNSSSPILHVRDDKSTFLVSPLKNNYRLKAIAIHNEPESELLASMKNLIKCLEGSFCDHLIQVFASVSCLELRNELDSLSLLKGKKPSLLLENETGFVICDFNDTHLFQFTSFAERSKDFHLIDIPNHIDITDNFFRSMALLYNTKTKSYNNVMVWTKLMSLLTLHKYEENVFYSDIETLMFNSDDLIRKAKLLVTSD